MQQQQQVSVSRMERLKMQRDEWENYICTEMCDVVEMMLRDMYQAAEMVARAKGYSDPTLMFNKIVMKLPTWSDQELTDEFSDTPDASPDERRKKAERVDEYIKNVVWSQATLMSLSCGKACTNVINVPNASSFLRMVVADVAGDHNSKIFGTSDMKLRAELKQWINKSIKKRLLSLIPIDIFTITEHVEIKPDDSQKTEVIEKQEVVAVLPPPPMPIPIPEEPKKVEPVKEEEPPKVEPAKEEEPTVVKEEVVVIKESPIEEKKEVLPPLPEEDEDDEEDDDDDEEDSGSDTDISEEDSDADEVIQIPTKESSDN